jgi:hypothetical protein
VEWPCGVDLCPVAMHQEIVAAKSARGINVGSA